MDSLFALSVVTVNLQSVWPPPKRLHPSLERSLVCSSTSPDSRVPNSAPGSRGIERERTESKLTFPNREETNSSTRCVFGWRESQYNSSLQVSQHSVIASDGEDERLSRMAGLVGVVLLVSEFVC